MGRKVFAAEIILMMCIGILSGCNGKVEDYLTESESEGDSAGVLTQFADAEKWEDKIEVTMNDGQDLRINIRADIEIPETDTMSVVEVMEPEFDAAYKEQIVRAVLGNNTIYYNDDAHLPRQQLEERLEEYENILSEYNEDIERWTEGLENGTISDDQKMMLDLSKKERKKKEMEEKIEICSEALKHATVDYQPAEDFEEDFYLGELDGNTCTVSFEEADGYLYEKTKTILFESEEFQNYATGNSKCSMTMEEAEELAKKFLEKLGFSSMVMTYHDEGTRDDEIVSYSFLYKPGMGNVSFTTFSREGEGVEGGTSISAIGCDELYKRAYEGEALYSSFSRADIIVTDEGVIRAEICNPVEVLSTTSNVELLPLDTIQNIILNGFKEDIEQFDLVLWDNLIGYDSLELGYLRMTDKEHERYYSYIPVWRMCKKSDFSVSMGYMVYINAIDGSVIRYGDSF